MEPTKITCPRCAEWSRMSAARHRQAQDKMRLSWKYASLAETATRLAEAAPGLSTGARGLVRDARCLADALTLEAQAPTREAKKLARWAKECKHEKEGL